MPDPTDLSAGDDLSGHGRDLRLVSRQLKWQLIEHEHNLEALQRTRRQRARLREQVDVLSDALADTLSARYWDARPPASGGGVGRLLGRAHADPEADLVREVEVSELFDGGWYLRSHAKAVRSGLSPALHYVRHGNAKRLNPGPRFSTSSHLEMHPEALDSGLPALLHATRHGLLHESPDDTDAAASPARDLHL